MKFTLLPFNGLPETNINKQEIPSEMKVEATMSWPQLHLDFQLPSSHRPWQPSALRGRPRTGGLRKFRLN